jgi:hypothetical protein
MDKTAMALVEHACRAAARMPRAPSAAGGRAGLAGDRRLACPSTLGAVQLRSVMVSSSVKERGMSGMVGSGVTGGPAGPGEAAGAPRSDKFFDVTGANFAQVVNDRCVNATQGARMRASPRKVHACAHALMHMHICSPSPTRIPGYSGTIHP